MSSLLPVLSLRFQLIVHTPLAQVPVTALSPALPFGVWLPYLGIRSPFFQAWPASYFPRFFSLSIGAFGLRNSAAVRPARPLLAAGLNMNCGSFFAPFQLLKKGLVPLSKLRYSSTWPSSAAPT